jgi:hypothetical protein
VRGGQSGNTLVVLAEPRVSDELSALLATLDSTHPSSLTSCPGWTAHHIAAHIAGNYEEVRRHVEAPAPPRAARVAGTRGEIQGAPAHAPRVAGDRSYSARVRAPGRDDLLVEVADGDARLSIEAPAGGPTIAADPAARLLILWGRKPTPFSRLRACTSEDEAGRVQLVLSGY